MTIRRHPMLDPRGRPPQVTEIRPRFFVGEYPRPEDVPVLHSELALSAVVSLQDDDDLAIKGLRLAELSEAYRSHGIEFRRVPVADNDPDALTRALPEALACVHSFLDAGHRVLLHCNAGYNRAPTVAIAYLHAHCAMPLPGARDLVKSLRPCLPFMTVLERHFTRR